MPEPQQYPEFAEFDFHTVVGPFQPRIEAMQPTSVYHGLGMQVQYVYAFLTDDRGHDYVVERKFMGSMSGGTYIMCNEGGTLGLLAATSRTARGELRRTSTPKLRRWAEPVLQRISGPAAPQDEAPLTIELTDDTILWDEGDVLHLEGTTGALGVQGYAPMPNSTWFYASYPHRVSGEVLGRPVYGIAVLETGYWPHGIEPKEFAFYADLELSFNAFGNLFEDGAMQWGYIVRGKRGLCMAVVVEDRDGEGSVVTCSNELDVRYRFVEGNQVHYARQSAGGDVWEFRSDETGHMDAFVASRWGGYGSMGGTTTRLGDERRLRFGYGWFEYFSDRIPAEKRLEA